MNVVVLTAYLLPTTLCISLPSLPPTQKRIFDELPWTVKIKAIRMLNTTIFNSSNKQTRIVGISYLRNDPSLEEVIKMRVNGESTTQMEDDQTMKIKLFRLMYETIKNNEMKLKRADDIEAFYGNNHTFRIGRLIGDVMDKYNVIGDIEATLKKLYNDWKPIEHINAYEQIANQAVEINNMIDLIRSMAQDKEFK